MLTKLPASDAALVTRVEQDREAAIVAGFARRFTALVRGSSKSRKADPNAALTDLEAWLADARTSGPRAVETFASGLEQDDPAVRAALTTPWSSGQAESQITRLKLRKRQMYGRAGFDLLATTPCSPPDPHKVRKSQSHGRSPAYPYQHR